MPLPGGILDQDRLYIYILKHAIMWMDQRRELDQQKNQRDIPNPGGN